jgi:hypothetical protein
MESSSICQGDVVNAVTTRGMFYGSGEAYRFDITPARRTPSSLPRF